MSVLDWPFQIYFICENYKYFFVEIWNYCCFQLTVAKFILIDLSVVSEDKLEVIPVYF